MTQAPAGDIRVTVAVTEDHIADGPRGTVTKGPLSLAIADALLGVAWAEVYTAVSRMVTVRFNDGTQASGDLPGKAADLTRRHDKGLPVAPLEFDLILEASRP